MCVSYSHIQYLQHFAIYIHWFNYYAIPLIHLFFLNIYSFTNVTGPSMYVTLRPDQIEQSAGALDSIIVYTVSGNKKLLVSNRTYNSSTKYGTHFLFFYLILELSREYTDKLLTFDKWKYLGKTLVC